MRGRVTRRWCTTRTGAQENDQEPWKGLGGHTKYYLEDRHELKAICYKDGDIQIERQLNSE